MRIPSNQNQPFPNTNNANANHTPTETIRIYNNESTDALLQSLTNSVNQRIANRTTTDIGCISVGNLSPTVSTASNEPVEIIQTQASLNQASTNLLQATDSINVAEQATRYGLLSSPWLYLTGIVAGLGIGYIYRRLTANNTNSQPQTQAQSQADRVIEETSIVSILSIKMISLLKSLSGKK